MLLCAGLIAWQLFVPPALGVADNNDFPKLIGRFCLGPAAPEQYPLFEYVSFSYSYGQRYCWDSELGTSAVLPMRIAILGAKAVLPAERFDMRLLGAVYALLFLGAFHALQRLARRLRPPARALLPPVALLIFGGASYVPWFNSFYFDTASYVFLMIAAVAVCRLVWRPEVGLWEYLLTAACAILFAASKAQHALLALPMLPCLWCAFGRLRFPARWLRAAVCAAIGLAAWLTLSAQPPWYRPVNLYNALFYKCLPRSSDPAADLAQLGVDPALLPYVGQHSFLPGSPMKDPQRLDQFRRQISTSKMVAYYLSHPRVAALVLLDALDEGSLQRVRMKIGRREYRLGNYERSAGRLPEAQSHFLDWWSELKAALFGGRPLLYLAYAAGLLSALWVLALRRPAEQRPRATSLVGALTGMVALAAAFVLFDGIDTGRHLFLFNALLDVAVCALVAA